MLYRRESELGVRMDRKFRRLVKELRGSCELLACDAESFEYQLDMSVRRQSWREILQQMQDEALTVVGMCEHVKVLLDKGVAVCRS